MFHALTCQRTNLKAQRFTPSKPDSKVIQVCQLSFYDYEQHLFALRYFACIFVVFFVLFLFFAACIRATHRGAIEKA